MISQWVHDALQALERDAVCAIITVARVVGSAPRDPGTRMVVTRSLTYGTIGGGALEYRAVQCARRQLLGNKRSEQELLRLTLGPVTAKDGLGQCCGGVVWLLVEKLTAPIPDWLQCLAALRFEYDRSAGAIVMATRCTGGGEEGHLLLSANANRSGTLGSVNADRDARRQLQQLKRGSVVLNDAVASAGALLLEDLTPTAPTVVLFGGGHVGSALIKVLQPLELPLMWIDSRLGMLPEVVPSGVQAITTCAPEAAVDAAAAGSVFLVMTHQHVLDYRLVVNIFQRGDARFCGLIGSASKRLKAERELLRAGFSAERVAQQLTCPIGINGIRSKQPTAIAIAVAAQLLWLLGDHQSESDANAAQHTGVSSAHAAMIGDSDPPRHHAITVAFEPDASIAVQTVIPHERMA